MISPRRFALLASAALYAPSAFGAACTSGTLDAANGNLLPQGYLSTSGSQTVSSTGQTVRITSVGGSMNPSDFPAMVAAGVNTIRLSYWDNTLSSDLAQMKSEVAAATAAGLKVIINHHANTAGGACWSQQPNGLPFSTGSGDGCGGGVSEAQYEANMVTVAQAFAAATFDGQPLHHAGDR